MVLLKLRLLYIILHHERTYNIVKNRKLLDLNTLEEESFAGRKFRVFAFFGQFAKFYSAKYFELTHPRKFILTKYENFCLLIT